MSDEHNEAQDADVIGKFLARSHAALVLAEGTPERDELEQKISLTMIGAQAHALQSTLGIAPYSIIVALRELADIGEQKLIETGRWPEGK